MLNDLMRLLVLSDIHADARALDTVLADARELAWDQVLASAHVLATLFFFACVALRFAAVASIRPLKAPARMTMPDGV